MCKAGCSFWWKEPYQSSSGLSGTKWGQAGPAPALGLCHLLLPHLPTARLTGWEKSSVLHREFEVGMETRGVCCPLWHRWWAGWAQPFPAGIKPSKLQEYPHSLCSAGWAVPNILSILILPLRSLPCSTIKSSLNLNPSLDDICAAILIFEVQRWRPQQPAWLPWQNRTSFTKLLCREREGELRKAHVCCRSTCETANFPTTELQLRGSASQSCHSSA